MKKLGFARLLTIGLVFCFYAAFVFSPSLSAQTTYGSIAGAVTDPSGAAIADAQVSLTNIGTAEKRVQTTGPDGLYDFVNLIPARYRIDVEKTGFKRTARPDVIVEVGQSVRIDLSMQVGDVTQTIEVSGETPQLQAETSSLGQVVEERKANELPLNGRNVFNLISLAPSVVPQGSAWRHSRRCQSIRLGQLSGEWLFRKRERGISGWSASKHRLYQSAGGDPDARLHSGIQSADQQSGSRLGKVLRRCHQLEHQIRHQQFARRLPTSTSATRSSTPTISSSTGPDRKGRHSRRTSLAPMPVGPSSFHMFMMAATKPSGSSVGRGSACAPARRSPPPFLLQQNSPEISRRSVPRLWILAAGPSPPRWAALASPELPHHSLATKFLSTASIPPRWRCSSISRRPTPPA